MSLVSLAVGIAGIAVLAAGLTLLVWSAFADERDRHTSDWEAQR